MSAIIDLLVKIQLLDDRQHDAVMSRARGGNGGHVVQQVAEMGYATESTVARAISVELGLPRIDLSMTPPEEEAVALLDARTCADRFVLPVALRESGELLWLAMADPTDQEAVSLVRRKSGKRVRPAVAGPSEILRAVRVLYAAPSAGMNLPEDVPREKLAAIEIADQQEDAFEVTGVSEDIAGSPLSRIAAQLGVAVPPGIASKARKGPADEPHRLDELDRLAPGPAPLVAEGALDIQDLTALEALRSSLEKGALVLRAVAELCVEKGVFTRDEMRRRGR